VRERALRGRRGRGLESIEREGVPLYTLTILNVVLSWYTFDPSQSVLSKSITVRRGRIPLP
jgi:hypothetical protein